MEITNRSILVLVAVTVVLLAIALLLALQPTAPPPRASPEAPAPKRLIPQVTREGGETIESSGPLTVSLQRGASAETASLLCQMFRSERAFRRGVLQFPTIPLGDCALKLTGSEREYAPVFPGDRLSCRVHEGRTECTGGVAWEKAATVSVSSDLPGTLRLNGQEVGELPAVGLKLNVGGNLIEVALSDGSSHQWDLRVSPRERVQVHFPVPGGDAAAGAQAQATAPGI